LHEQRRRSLSRLSRDQQVLCIRKPLSTEVSQTVGTQDPGLTGTRWDHMQLLLIVNFEHEDKRAVRRQVKRPSIAEPDRGGSIELPHVNAAFATFRGAAFAKHDKVTIRRNVSRRPEKSSQDKSRSDVAPGP
jgi:hypothetical protein